MFHLLFCKIRMLSPLPFFTFVFLLLHIFTNSKTKHKMEKLRFAIDRLKGGGMALHTRCVRANQAAAFRLHPTETLLRIWLCRYCGAFFCYMKYLYK